MITVMDEPTIIWQNHTGLIILVPRLSGAAFSPVFLLTKED